MTLKFDLKRGWATTANELCFAVMLMDFSQAESGLVISAIPYMYSAPPARNGGAPNKSSLVKVKHSEWLKNQRDKGAAYRALKRLFTREVFRLDKRNGAINLNTRYGQWRDANHELMFTADSQGGQKLRALMAAHTWWGDKDSMFAGAEAPENGDDPEAESGRASPGNSGRTSPEPVDVHHPNGGRTSPEPVDVHHPNGGRTSPAEARESLEISPASPPSSKQAMPVISKKAAASSADVLDFARDACRLAGTDLSDAGTVLATVADDPVDSTAATIAALEKLAARKNGKPENVGGWLRTVAEKFLDGESVTLPAGAITFEQWQQRRERNKAIDKALGALPNTPPPKAQAVNDGGEWAALADAFGARARHEQDAAIDECVRGKWPLATQLAATHWRDEGRRAWRETPMPLQAGKMLAVLEAIARKYVDPSIETVTVKNPAKA